MTWMVEPRPITVFFACFRVGCGFRGMIRIARRCPHCGTTKYYSTRSLAMSRASPFWNSSCFARVSACIDSGSARLCEQPVCSTITLILTNMPSSAAQLRQKLNARAVIGTFVKLGRREVIDILAVAGLDFAICDLEHSQITEQEAGNMITAGRACALPVVVRVAHFDPGQINRLLEAGAAGIQLPQLQTVEQASAFHSACKYPPHGSRSLSLAQPAASYGTE